MTSRNISIIPKAPMARMLLNVGAKRVSQPAIDAFTDIITSRAEHIAAKSIQIAKHSGRKTVQGEDIKLAVK